MFNKDILKTMWYRQPLKVDEGMIVRLPGELAKSESYNPFDHYNREGKPSLYLQFANLDPEDIEGIQRFIFDYGLLGLNPCPSEEAILIKNCIESIDDIKNEIICMKNFLFAIDTMSKKDVSPDILIEHIVKITTSLKYPQDKMVESLNKYRDDIETLGYFAMHYVSEGVSEQLKGVSPQLSFYYPSREFIARWDIQSLLSAMYCMLYMDLTEGKTIRQCHNLNCNKFFVVHPSETRKEYCSRSCTMVQSQRNRRETIKQTLRMYQEGKPIEEIVKETGRNKEQIKKWIKESKEE